MSSPGALPVNTGPVERELMFLFDVWDGVTAALLVTSTIAVGLRVFVRAKVTKAFGWDDAVMMAAWICFLICAVLSFIASQAFRDIVEDGKVVISYWGLLQTIRISNAAYSLTMLLVKISMAIFFIKLFASNFKWQRFTIIFLTAASTALGIAYLVFTFASCGIMIQSQKTTPYKTGSDWCPVQQIFVNFSIAWSIFNAFTDLVFAGLAIHIVWSAKMNTSTKVSAAILILFGCIGGVASIARVAVQLPVTDVRMSGVLLTIWSNTEGGVCVTAASLITLRPLFQSTVDRVKSTFSSLKSSNISKGGSYGSKQSHSTTSSKKDIMEIIDMEDGLKLDRNGVTVTRTYEVQDKDADSCRSDSWSQGGRGSRFD